MDVQTTDSAAIKKQALKFKSARGNLLAVIVFTVINLLLKIAGSSYYFLFSATGPHLVYEIAQELSQEYQSNIFLIIGLVIACVIILLYFICWIFSKRVRSFMLVAFILFSIDILLYTWLLLDGFDTSFIIDIAFRGWVFYYLINGVIAFAKLKNVSADEFNALTQANNVVPASAFSTVDEVSDEATTNELETETPIIAEDVSASDEQ